MGLSSWGQTEVKATYTGGSIFVRGRKVLGITLEEISDFGFSASPCCHQIKLQDHYGNGMKNRKVYLVIRFMRRRFIKTYITDDSGIASFNLDTTAWNSSSVSLEVNPTSAYRKVRILELCQCSPLLPCSPPASPGLGSPHSSACAEPAGRHQATTFPKPS